MLTSKVTWLFQQAKGNGLGARLVQGALGASGLRIVSMLLSVLTGVLLARLLGVSGYGTYALVMSVTALLTIPVEFGLPSLLTREVAASHAKQDWPTMRGIIRWTNKVVLLASLTLSIVISVAIWSGLPDQYGESTFVRTLQWSLLLVPLVALGNLRGAALRGLHNFIRGLIPELVIRPGVFVLLLTFAALAYGTTVTAQSAMALHVAAAAVAFLGGIFLLNQVMPSPCHTAIPVTKSKVWVTSAVPLALAEGMRHLQGHVGALTLGWFATSTEVGLFRVAESAAGLTWLPSTILLGVIMPSIASLFASGDQRRLQKLVVYATAGMFLGALSIALILFIFGYHLLAIIFGTDFTDANNAMLVLAFGQLLNSAIGPTVVLLNMTGQERAVSHAFMYSFALNVVVAIALVPLLGVMGAALASAISFLAWNIILWRHSRKTLRIETSLYGLVKFTSP